MKTISVVTEEEVYERLKAYADADKRSVSNWIVILIERELTKRTVENA